MKTVAKYYIFLFFFLLMLVKIDAKAINTEHESNDTIESANVLTNNAFINGNIMSYEDVDYYKINVPQNGYMSFAFKHDFVNSTSTFWKVLLYNSNMEYMSEWTYDGNTLEEKRTSNMGITSGVYYVKVIPYSYSKVNYQLKYSYSASEVWEREFNNSYDKANDLSVGSYKNGNLMNHDDADFYKISVPQNGYMSLAFKHDFINRSSTYWKILLYDSNMEYMSEWSYDGDTLDEKRTPNLGVASGTYYVKVTYYNYSDVNYQLKYNYSASEAWEREFNDSYDKANDLSVGSYKNGNLMSYDDVDFYKINISQNAYISFSFKHDFINSSSIYWKMILYNSNMEDMTEWNYQGDKTNDDSQANVGLARGTYYIKVVHYNYSPLNYQIAAKQITLVSSIGITGNNSGNVGDKIQLSANIAPQNATNKGISWSSSDTSIISINDSGVASCLKAGTATITAKAKDGGGAVGTITITVVEPPKQGGAAEEEAHQISTNNIIYVIEGNTASVISAFGTSKSINIESKITANKKTYPVTTINAKAFKGNKNITSVNIPNTITDIGAEAFSQCSNLKTVKINANQKLKVGKKAFKNLKKGSKIKVTGVKGTTKKKIVKKLKKQITKSKTKVK